MTRKLSLQRQKEGFQILYDNGWSDSPIASLLRTAPKTIRTWRTELGLPVNRAYQIKIDHDEAVRMHANGASDGEIAKSFGVTQSGATRWRQRAGLRPNHPYNQPYSEEIKRKVRKLLRFGASARLVAEELGGLDRKGVLRIRAGMKAKGLRRTGLSDRAIRSQVLNDPQVARRIEVAVGRGLPLDVRADAVGDLYLDVLSGKIASRFIEKVAPSYRNRAFNMCGSKFGPRSLDEELADGWTLGDTIADPTSLDDNVGDAADRWLAANDCD